MAGKKKLFIFFILLFFELFVVCTTTAGQNTLRIDSLENLAKITMADSDKINLLLALSKEYGCDDTGSKIRAAKGALEIADKLQNKKLMANISFTLGLIYGSCCHNYAYAIKSFTAGVSFAEYCHDTDLTAKGLEFVAQSYERMGNLGMAIEFYRDMIHRDISPDLKIGAFSNVGEIYSSLGMYKQGLNCFDSALLISRAMKKDPLSKKSNEAFLKIAIADVYSASGENKAALNNYDSAYSLFKQTTNHAGQLLALTGLGKAYQALGDTAKAIEYYQLVLIENARKNTKDKNLELTLYNQLAKLYLENGNLLQAADMCNKSLDLVKSCPDNALATISYIIMGKIYTKQQAYSKAIRYYNIAIQQCENLHLRSEEKDALIELSDLYERLKMPEMALKYFKRSVTISDSIHSVDEAKEIIRHEVSADFKEKEALLAAEQDKKNAIMSLTIKRERLISTASAIIILLIIVVVYLFYNKFRLRKKLDMQMAISEERSRISAEMHDDIGSELSKISLMSEMIKLNAPHSNTQQYLNNIYESSSELLDKLGEIVWSLNNSYDKVESLIIYFRRYAMEYFNGTDITCKIIMSEHFPDITIEGPVRRNMLLIVKEALHNVLKHSACDTVIITIISNNNYIDITISDNGKGINMAAIPAFGNGLNNMSKRIAMLGGKFTINSQKGTTLSFFFPLVGQKHTNHKWVF